MQYLTPLHISTYVLLVFASGHTLGLCLPHDYTPAANAVLASMKTVHFDFNGSDCTFYGFYTGFGLMVTVFMLFSAFLTWLLAEAKASDRAVLKPIAWALLLAYLPMTGLSWMYFFVFPGVFSTVITGLIGWGCWTKY
ncbi:hypothetical protein V1525DRAFT_413453 [Lipomyces kononenkoae]|uniref:Uncharacterized protein n=1 Tax=Lipomyces kononenkoae TaxID=34357 RepID=A0ACC3SRQ8_LIPKO